MRDRTEWDYREWGPDPGGTPAPHRLRQESFEGEAERRRPVIRAATAGGARFRSGW
jgi:hypothetical protein